MDMETINIQNNMDIEKINALSANLNSTDISERLNVLCNSMQSFCNICANTDKIKDGLASMRHATEQFEKILSTIRIPTIDYGEEIRKALENTIRIDIREQLKHMDDSVFTIIRTLGNYRLLYLPSNYPDEENVANREINSKIIDNIFCVEPENHKEKSTIITLSPINDKVLLYLSKNPNALYQLKDREFEVVMAEIYNKLGYEVELTKATRDGGKDIILRKPEILGDFIYYVECKQNAPKRPIGVGIIRNLIGTIDTDRVNGGILATTSYFSSDVKKFIDDNNYNFKIQMHDYDVIRGLLDRVI